MKASSTLLVAADGTREAWGGERCVRVNATVDRRTIEPDNKRGLKLCSASEPAEAIHCAVALGRA